jgi:heterodisulfide reductase subunit A
MYTAKHAIMLKEHDPDIQCYVFYIDVRAGGKDFEEFYLRALDDAGATYIKGRPSKIYRDGNKMIVLGEDALMGRPIEIAADLVVLATGMEPRDGADKLAQLLNISYNTYHFLVEAHPKLRPVETQTDGIFVAGACVGPRDIPESVAQGSAAAVKVVALFSQDKLTTEPLVATINKGRCTGCLLCMLICPYKAIEYETTRDGQVTAVVNESLCKGCGLCAGTCRPKAIDLRGFTSQQILEEVNSLWS